LTADELRQLFLDFFASRGHVVLPGASLVPSDPTTLFTIAGMQQFVPSFRGEVPIPAARVATCQPCLRIDDLEKVGRTASHETFFEMLGNFSFGDYFKREAIAWAWDFVTREVSIPRERLWISVHPTDDEAFGIWRQDISIPEHRIVRLEENWWPTGGGLGPCGPDSEILYDRGEHQGCRRPECDPGCECGRFFELWNLVFQQYNRETSGELIPLPSQNIDTGMGLERLAALVQGKSTIFEADLFSPIVSQASALMQGKPSESGEAARIIADHCRAIAFAVADGVTPSNEGRGYVLRRLIRRAVRFGRARGAEPPFLHKVLPAVIQVMEKAYPNLRRREDAILKFARAEEERFEETIEQGSVRLERLFERAAAGGAAVLPGDEVFELYDTYGFPAEMTAEIARERGLTIDEKGFAAAMEQQRARARAAAEHAFAYNAPAAHAGLAARTKFVGYEATQAEGSVIALIVGAERVDSVQAGQEAEVVLDRTPFYAEAGGQVGDTGTLTSDGMRAEVSDTYYAAADVPAHRVKVIEGTLRVGDKVVAAVDAQRRDAIRRAHSATHVLHWALRQVLGPHALQAGSLVEPDRLRFDFSHFEALSPQEIEKIEELVAEKVLQAQPVEWFHTSLDEARKMGAIALFGEKYGQQVRVLKIADYSTELCGGTHASNTGKIGLCKILGESSIGAGLRRIEAVTGLASLRLAREDERLLEDAGRIIKASPRELPTRLQQVLAELREAQKALDRVQDKQAASLAERLAANAAPVDGVSLVVAPVSGLNPQALRGLADELVRKLGSSVVVLGQRQEDKVALVSEVSPDLVKRGLHAGNLVREVAQIAGGSGGGRPDFAQAGGKNPEKLSEALAAVPDILRRMLSKASR